MKRQNLGIVRVVRAPNPWRCANCGKEIPANAECVKLGRDTYCRDCVQEGM